MAQTAFGVRSVMVRVILVCGMVVGISAVAGWVMAQDTIDSSPKYTIKEVMQMGHKDGLVKKVLKDGRHKDAMELMDLYASLSEQAPPKGDAESWKAKTDALMIAVARVAVKRKDAAAKLKEASNCQACHSAHKGE